MRLISSSVANHRVSTAATPRTLRVTSQALEQCYFVRDMSVTAKTFRTATASRTAMRGPGEIQASIIMENVLERVAAASAAAAVAPGGCLVGEADCPAFSTMAHAQRVRDLNLFPAPIKASNDAGEDAAAQDPDEMTILEGDDYDATLAEESKDISGDALTHYTMHELWPTLKRDAALDTRMAAAAAFNGRSRWRKRGVAMTPVKYKVRA